MQTTVLPRYGVRPDVLLTEPETGVPLPELTYVALGDTSVEASFVLPEAAPGKPRNDPPPTPPGRPRNDPPATPPGRPTNPQPVKPLPPLPKPARP